MIDAGRAGFNRARGYNAQHNFQSSDGTVTEDSSAHSPREIEDDFNDENNEVTAADIASNPNGLHRRRSRVPPNIHANTEASWNMHQSTAISPGSNVSDGASIAGLLGLDEEFRIGNRQNGEDEVREVQLRALTRRIMASPSLVLFPAKKADIDVM